MNKKASNILSSLGIAVVTITLVYFMEKITNDGGYMNRAMQILGGEMPGGLVQFFTFWIFYFGMMELNSIARLINTENDAYRYRLLPEAEQYVLNPKEVNEIKLKILELERREGNSLVTNLIKKACTKFRSNKSTSEALEIVTTQVRINLASAESEQSMIRYVAWAIPSIGFIGTIIGIAGSLGEIGAEMNDEDIRQVSAALNIAFDTTLLSLLLSIILMFYFHTIQEKVEKFHLHMESYVIENLINRIYKM